MKNTHTTTEIEDRSAKEMHTRLAWERLYHRLEKDGLLDEPPGEKKRLALRPWMAAAASLLVFLSLGSLFLNQFRSEGRTWEKRMAAEGVQSVNLPDGSLVVLNEGAILEYPKKFRGDRSVRLDGEGFFQVMADPAHPFHVQSGSVRITVLGTRFNVKRNPGLDEVEVYVESGTVEVTSLNNAGSLLLEKGQFARATGTLVSEAPQEELNYLAWYTKDFRFVDAPLEEVLRALELAYHVEIDADGSGIRELRITTTYSQQTLDAILETIGTAFGLTVQRQEEGYRIRN
ncbi:MAG: FecR domain-containing protein [Bacteroidales bacterium]